MPKETPEQQLTKQDVETFIAQVKNSTEYEDLECRAVIDEISTHIHNLLVGPDIIEHPVCLEILDKKINAIAAAIQKAHEKMNQPELPELLSQSYDEMAEVLKYFGFGHPFILKTWVMEAVKALPLHMVETVRKFEKPTIIISPACGFGAKIGTIKTSYPHCINCSPSHDHELWGQNPTKKIVSIVDGIESMPGLAYIKNNMTIDSKIDRYKEEYRKHHLEMMDINEAAMLVMKSLKTGEYIDDSSLNGTETYYSMHGSNFTPNVHWESVNQNFDFNTYHFYGAMSHKVRCRPSLKLLEY